jgi:cytochrome c oxidase subunit 2
VSATPLSYLSSAGARADITLPLTWLTLIISILVCLIIAVLLWQAARRARTGGGAEATRAAPIERGGDGIRWIKTGLLLSTPALLVTLVWTMVALAKVSGPPRNPALTLDVTGHQWWWEVQYQGAAPAETFRTANEIHIPVGVPVLLRLHGADVIHSFWVPKLSGKTDTIPGQTNLSWLEAREPGRYQGQCTEYCGLQHAHMGFEVVAESQDEFERWRAHQLEPASAPVSAQQQRGMQLVQYRCGLCHEVRGTSAGAISAPDLTHLMSRRMLAAGSLINTPGTLVGWVQNPQSVKPGSLMPDQFLSARQLSDLRAYLESLQ